LPSTTAGIGPSEFFFNTWKAQSLKTNVFVRLAVSVALVASVAACMRPGETIEEFQARMRAAAALAGAAAASAAAATPQPAPHGPFWNTTCSQSGMYYNCMTY
jgi:hypothetical protein